MEMNSQNKSSKNNNNNRQRTTSLAQQVEEMYGAKGFFLRENVRKVLVYIFLANIVNIVVLYSGLFEWLFGDSYTTFKTVWVIVTVIINGVGVLILKILDK